MILICIICLESEEIYEDYLIKLHKEAPIFHQAGVRLLLVTLEQSAGIKKTEHNRVVHRPVRIQHSLMPNVYEALYFIH